jgi:hypothetical protein
LGLSCSKFGDHCHHPNNHGFDYFFGLPLTNFRNLGYDSNVMFEARPESFRNVVVSAVTVFLSILVMKLYFKVGNCVTIFMFLVYSVVFLFLVPFLFHSAHIWNGVLMRNDEIIEQPIRLDDRMTERLVNEGVRFLEKQTTDQPFVLYMSWLQTHTALHAADNFKGEWHFL